MDKKTQAELTEEILPDFQEIIKKGMADLVKHEREFFDKKVDTVIQMLEDGKELPVYSRAQVISLLTILKEKK